MREFVMLATPFDAAKHRVGGMYMSEKLDGMRALWLPATRGRRVADLPFANTDKDHRDHVASGLWSRYGKPIFCPDSFLDGFPDHPLDGELWKGRNTFQELMSAVKKLEPVPAEWQGVTFRVFDHPRYTDVFTPGKVNNPNYKRKLGHDSLEALGLPVEPPVTNRYFDFVYRTMVAKMKETATLIIHPQKLTPFSTEKALIEIEAELDRVTSEGGEGLMLRHCSSQWEPVRSRFLLKVKKLHDAEGQVVGYRAGQGKYLGMLGSLTVKWEHGTFELSGFTDEERQLDDASEALAAPGEIMRTARAVAFQPGTLVTFRYRELTNDGAPKEARYWRKAT